MKISSVSVDSRVIRGPLQVIAAQPVVLEHYDADSKSQTGKVFAGLSAAGISQQAWAGFQATNTTGLDEMAKFLVKNGLAPEHAPSVAKRAMEVIQAEPTKVLLIAVSAGGGLWAAIEAGRTLFGLRMSRIRQLIFALLFAAVAGLAYHYFRSKGLAA